MANWLDRSPAAKARAQLPAISRLETAIAAPPVSSRRRRGHADRGPFQNSSASPAATSASTASSRTM